MARTVPVFPTETPGNYITGALFNATVGALGAWSVGSGSNGPPRFQGYASTAQSIASGATFMSCTLDTEIADSDGGHSTTTNTSRYTVQVAGTYLLIASVGYPGTSTAGNRAVRVGINGTGAQGGQQALSPAGSNSWYALATAWAPLNAGDYVECQTWQNSGSSLSTNSGAITGPTLTCLWYSS